MVTAASAVLLASLEKIPPDDRPADDFWAELTAAAAAISQPGIVAIIQTMLGGGSEYWCDTPDSPPTLPADHRLHLDYGPEWYWLTCNLEVASPDAQKTQIGIFAGIDRVRVVQKDVQMAAGMSDADAQLVESHLMMVIAAPGAAPRKLVREPNLIWPPLGGEIAFGADPFLFRCGPDSVAGTLNVLPLVLTVADSQFSVELTFDTDMPVEKAFFLGGERGLTPEPRAGIYYSWPQLTVTGTITVDGVPQKVSGKGWIDHESMSAPKTVNSSSPALRWSPGVGLDGWTFCNWNFDNGNVLVMAGFQIGPMQPNLPAPYGFYLRRQGDSWLQVPITGQIEMSRFLPVTEGCLLPVSWRVKAQGQFPGEGPAFDLEGLATPISYDCSLLVGNCTVQGEALVQVAIVDRSGPMLGVGPGVAMLGSGCCESVGYELAERYVDRVRPILRAAAAAAA